MQNHNMLQAKIHLRSRFCMDFCLLLDGVNSNTNNTNLLVTLINLLDKIDKAMYN